MSQTVVIAGGGTGGHIYPAVAIAKAMIKQNPEIKIHFVGTRDGLESKIVPREGFPIHYISVGKLNFAGGVLGKLKTLISIPLALFQSIGLLWTLKPVAVLGVGGYASGPFVLMAGLMGFRSAIWEPNAQPGLTNRWLSRVVGTSFVVFDDAKQFFKSKSIVSVGLPVRSEVEALFHSSQTREPGPLRVLVFGGSQGARALNKIVRETFTGAYPELADTQLVHQTGPHDISEMKAAYDGKANLQAFEYLHDMEKRYAWADLVICRAGASTVAELGATVKPAILVPLPWAADDHQRKNALSLVNVSAGKMIIQADLTPQALLKEILDLKNNPEKLVEMKKNLRKFHKPHAAENIAKLLLGNEGQ